MSDLTGRAVMPAPGTSKAPKTFDGHDSELEDFLDHFEALAGVENLDDNYKVSQLGKYATHKQRSLFKALDGYAPADWKKFKKALCDLYPDAFPEDHYTRQALEKFTAKAAGTEVTGQAGLYDYYRGFLPIAQWLVSNKNISEEDRNRLFWFGFHPRTRKRLQRRLDIAMPYHDDAIPFEHLDVLKAGKKIFSSSAFDPGLHGGKSESLWKERMDREDDESEDESTDEHKKQATKNYCCLRHR